MSEVPCNSNAKISRRPSRASNRSLFFSQRKLKKQTKWCIWLKVMHWKGKVKKRLNSYSPELRSLLKRTGCEEDQLWQRQKFKHFPGVQHQGVTVPPLPDTQLLYFTCFTASTMALHAIHVNTLICLSSPLSKIPTYLPVAFCWRQHFCKWRHYYKNI